MTKPAPPVSPDATETFLGKDALITLGKIDFTVTILELRNRYGNIDAKIRPHDGYGSDWVWTGRLNVL